MQRREFMVRLGGAAASAMLVPAARAQPANKVYRIGYLSLGSPAAEETRFNAFRAGLSTLGYSEGKDLVIETRWLDGEKVELLPALAAQLVQLKVDVIVTYTTPGVLAAKRATTSIPIIFTSAGDAVASGLVASLTQPGGNATGNTYFLPELAAKRLELLNEAIPGLNRAGVLLNPDNPATEAILSAMKNAARQHNLELTEFDVRETSDLDAAFVAMDSKPVRGFVLSEDPLLVYSAETSANLALKHRLAACGFPEFALAGGFVGFGIDFVEMWRHAASFVDKILKGAKPADLPVEQATKFITIVNRKTAAEIGIDVAASVLSRADQVIE